MFRQATIRTGARLHCGLFAPGSRTGRQHGGVGLMIDAPGFILRATRSNVERIQGDPYWCERISRLLSHYPVGNPQPWDPPTLHWEVVQAIPPHSGLGSGTQLGLAVAKILSSLRGEPELETTELARRSGRGLRSAVGLHGFSLGGLLLEGGKEADAGISPLISRVAIPHDWRFVLMRPIGGSGLSGTEEQQGFARLGSMPVAATDRLCRLAVMDLIPAAIEANFSRFSAALDEYGGVVGDYFAPVQGGVYADPALRRLVPRLRAKGYAGIAQSSWGPTLFVCCSNAALAQQLVAELEADADCRH
ncbi:MAG: GHMP kinase, partial [Planctomycetales bacterium]